jgi:DNA-binding IclR family transcriptional regulator
MAADDSAGVLGRITAIFDALGDDDRGIGISELAAQTGLPKSTVSRLVSGLVRQHYLERDGAAIRLGLRLFELGQLAERPRELRRAALPVMSVVRDETGASLELAIRDGTDVVCIAIIRGRSPVALPSRLGERTPTHTSITGLAVLSRSQVREVWRTRSVDEAATERRTLSVASPVFSAQSGIDAALRATCAADTPAAERLGTVVDAAAMTIGLRL